MVERAWRVSLPMPHDPDHAIRDSGPSHIAEDA